MIKNLSEKPIAEAAEGAGSRNGKEEDLLGQMRQHKRGRAVHSSSMKDRRRRTASLASTT